MKFALGALLVLVVSVGCSEGGDDPAIEAAPAVEVRGVSDGEVVIGSYTDLSGPTAIWGVGATNAARLRFDEQNAVGGVHGRKIRFIVEDTQYQVPRAIAAANKLINRDEIFAMVLAVGTPMNNAIMPQQFEAGVPNLFPITGARSMVEPFHRLKFMQRGIYYDEVRAGIKHFVENEGKKSVCVIYQDTDYGQEVLEAAQDQAAEMGMTVAATSAHKPTESEFTAAILRLKNAGCDLVMMGTVHRDTILVLDAARKMGWEDVAWVGNNAAYAQVIADHPAGQGYYCFVHMAKLYPEDEKSSEAQAWWDAYVEAYGEDPGVAAMEGYRAASLVIEGLERAGPELTVDGLVSAMEGIEAYTDIFGYTVGYSAEKHSGVSDSALAQVQDGRWVELQKVSY